MIWEQRYRLRQTARDLAGAPAVRWLNGTTGPRAVISCSVIGNPPDYSVSDRHETRDVLPEYV
jgi:hypothetical protein